MPHLVQIAAHYEARGLTVIGVTSADVEATRAFVVEHRLPLFVLADGGEVQEKFGVDLIWGSPAFLLDSEGRVIEEGIGAIEDYLVGAE